MGRPPKFYIKALLQLCPIKSENRLSQNMAMLHTMDLCTNLIEIQKNIRTIGKKMLTKVLTLQSHFLIKNRRNMANPSVSVSCKREPDFMVFSLFCRLRCILILTYIFESIQVQYQWSNYYNISNFAVSNVQNLTSKGLFYKKLIEKNPFAGFKV